MFNQKQLKTLIYYNPITGSFVQKNQKALIKAEVLQDGFLYLEIESNWYKAVEIAYVYEFDFVPEMLFLNNNDPFDLRFANIKVKYQVKRNQSTGLAGIYFNKRANRYSARNGKKYLGSFATLEEAKQALEQARQSSL